MQALKCEMCGSNDIVKQDGLYVCQYCGTKYSVDEAKKLMSGVTVVVDNRGSVANYMTLAKNAIEASNMKEAEDYCNKIIEIDTNNAEVWFLKGKAAGWSATVAKTRLDEVVTNFSKALELDNSEEFKETVQKEIDLICGAIMELAAEQYVRSGSVLSGQSAYVVFEQCKEGLSTLHQKYNINDSRIESLAKVMLVGIIGAYNTVKFEFNEKDRHPGDFSFSDYLEKADNALAILKVMEEYIEDKEYKIMLHEHLLKIYTDKECSCSYTIGQGGDWVVSKFLTEESKKKLIDHIMEEHEVLNKLDSSHKVPKQVKPTSHGPCYIATAVYGSYDCPEVWTLRRFRDDILAATFFGRAFIHTYYAISPTIVKLFGQQQWFKMLWQKPLDMLVAKLISKGVSNLPYEDKNW